jgi:hypothetical protein
VGAVDEAGEETSFTSFGSPQIWAKGIDVEAQMPGGLPTRCNGTSCASPLVAGLAAKLLAVAPKLTAAQVRAAILETAEERKTPEGRTLRLLHPRKALERVKGQ